MKTRLTELLGIKHPIIQPGMANVAEPELVAAVCNAGGLGFLPLNPVSPEGYRQQIRRVKELVGNKPFGCNISPLVPGAENYIKVWLEEKVPVWGSAIRDPFRILGIKKPADIIYIPTVGNTRQAKKMEELKLADAVMAHCVEGGGHPGRIAASVFIPKAADSLKIPVIMAGGVCDGKGLAAALAMGAEGVAMGTRFALTRECRLPEEVKKRYLAADEDETNLSKVYDGIACNVLEGDKIRPYRGWWRHPWDIIPDSLHHKRVLGASWGTMFKEASNLRKMGVNPIQFVVGMSMFEKGLLKADLHQGLFWAGQVVGRIDDIPTCQELIERTVREAEEIIKTLYQRFGAAA